MKQSTKEAILKLVDQAREIHTKGIEELDAIVEEIAYNNLNSIQQDGLRIVDIKDSKIIDKLTEAAERVKNWEKIVDIREEKPKKTLSDISTLEVGDEIENWTWSLRMIKEVGKDNKRIGFEDMDVSEEDMRRFIFKFWWKLKEENQFEKLSEDDLIKMVNECKDINTDMWKNSYRKFMDEIIRRHFNKK